MVDEGIGIHPEEQPKIFSPFFSTANQGSRKMNPNGNGLGLSICKNIAKALKGDITFTSQIGLGTCFTLTLPLQATSDSAAMKTPGKPDLGKQSSTQSGGSKTDEEEGRDIEDEFAAVEEKEEQNT